MKSIKETSKISSNRADSTMGFGNVSGIGKRIVTLSAGLACVGMVACSSGNQKTEAGAGIGAGTGAALGAIIGNQQGNAGKGAAVGAMLGGAFGGLVGHRLDNQAKELKAVAETKRTEDGIVSKLKSDILFDTGKAELKPAAAENLAKMADILKKYPENVLTIKGYTDSTGGPAVNKTLSEHRADAVRSVLVAHGVPAPTVATEGLGPAEPVAPNTTSEGRAQNRRVEVEIKVDPSKVPKDAQTKSARAGHDPHRRKL